MRPSSLSGCYFDIYIEKRLLMLRWCLLWARTYVTPGPQPTRWLLFSIYLLIYLKGHQHQPAIRRRLVKSWNAMNNPRGQSVITSDWFNPQTWLGFRCGTFLRHVAGRLILDEPSVIYCLINPYSRLISHEDEDGGRGGGWGFYNLLMASERFVKLTAK